MSVDKELRPYAPFIRPQLLKGKLVLQGHNTFKEFGPIDDATNAVMTTTVSYAADAVFELHSIIEALAVAKTEDIFVIGGIKTFKSFIKHADRMIIEQWQHLAPGAGSAMFDYMDWYIDDVKHHDGHSTYYVEQRK